jgi:N-acetylmuramoyl-L-alanine amidase
MRKIDYIVIHCTAGFGDVAAIKRFWKESLGWKTVGYHFFIYEDGRVEKLAPLEKVTNGVSGFNTGSIHIAYQGGVDKLNVRRSKDTRTSAQKMAIVTIIKEVLNELKSTQDIDKIIIQGHRDFSVDQNKNGVIDSWERIKECPSFDAKIEYKGLIKSFSGLKANIISIGVFLIFLGLVSCKTARHSQKTEIIRDSIKTETSIVERDSSIVMPYDIATAFLSFTDSNAIVYQKDSIPVSINLNHYFAESISIKGNKQANLKVSKVPGTHLISLNCICDTVSIQAKIKDYYNRVLKEYSSNAVEIKPVRYVPKYIQILAVIGFMTLFIIAILLLSKITKILS